ncbi:MAG TPA: putative sporulation protein YtxC [Bacillota bacterium]|jgi:putative sporulation protein YtxC|nr:putative sporulation protein YtxC [Bacillota bacterium]HOL09669.1 putative sporulation protein YtxC [Bacillota bacterium]HPO97521.1 putative sporulation protein YtxC [Bacillota bacterium]
MSNLTITTLKEQQEVKENLFQELNFLSREGINVNLQEQVAGKYLFLNCSIDENSSEESKESHEKILRYYLSNVITDCLMNPITKLIMSKILKTKYRDINQEDFQAIIQNAYSYLNNVNEDQGLEQNLIRHHQVLNEVNQYLANNDNLCLEGFLRFRLKNYFLEIEDSIEKAVDNFMLEQEYNEFIGLLQYFVDIQQPKIDQVHVLIKNKEEIFFLDELNVPVKPNEIRGSLTELEQEIDYDDWLLSALITMAPRRIILHISGDSEMVGTLEQVFRYRVSTCQGCPICQAKDKDAKVEETNSSEYNKVN